MTGTMASGRRTSTVSPCMPLLSRLLLLLLLLLISSDGTKTGSSVTRPGVRSLVDSTATLFKLDDGLARASTWKPSGGIGSSALRIGVKPLSRTMVDGLNAAGRLPFLPLPAAGNLVLAGCCCCCCCWASKLTRVAAGEFGRNLLLPPADAWCGNVAGSRRIEGLRSRMSWTDVGCRSAGSADAGLRPRMSWMTGGRAGGRRAAAAADDESSTAG